MHNLRVYLALLELDLRGRITYRFDFWVGIITAFVRMGLMLSVLGLIFSRVPALGGWTLPQAAFLYGFFSLVWGLTDLLAGRIRQVGWQIRSGELDGLLVQPVSAYVQLLPQVAMGPLGQIVTAVAVLVSASIMAGVAWSPLNILLCLIALCCSVTMAIGLVTALYGLSFWIPYPNLMFGIEELRELGRYPISVYPRWLQTVLTGAVPLGFAAYYPTGVISGALPEPWYFVLFGIPAALGAAGLGALVWRRGLMRYEGAGS